MSVRSLSFVSLALAAVVMSGCYKYAVKVGHGGDTSRAPSKTMWEHHFIVGAVGEGAIDVSSVCPSNDATVRIERNFVDAALGNVLGGGWLWAPSTVEVFCGNGSAASLELDAAGTEKLARSEGFADVVAEVEPAQLDAVLAFQGR